MIQLSGAGKRYGHKLLFENADWLITPESRIGLVGANGTGKSTIMKILAGSKSLDYGAISRAKGISTGYLPQDGLTLTGRTIFAECMSVFAELDAIEKEMESLTRSMSEFDHSGPEYSNVAERYQKLEHEFVARDGYTLEAQVGQVLTGLGFQRDDWTHRVRRFLGGWQMRIALAKLLLQQPNLLLLDEPTNHLDLEARNWLEYLTTYPYAFVLISHDRYFLDITVKRIVEIEQAGSSLLRTSNYDQYLAAKTMRKEQLESAYKTQHDRIEQLEVFINRFRYTATKAKQVQSRSQDSPSDFRPARPRSGPFTPPVFWSRGSTLRSTRLDRCCNSGTWAAIPRGRQPSWNISCATPIAPMPRTPPWLPSRPRNTAQRSTPPPQAVSPPGVAL